MGRLWHNILKHEMVHHKQGYYQGKVAWHLMLGFSLILKKPCYISNTKRERIFNARTSTTPSSLRKDMQELQTSAPKQQNVLGRIFWHLLNFMLWALGQGKK
jgi:hypothetical protein